MTYNRTIMGSLKKIEYYFVLIFRVAVTRRVNPVHGPLVRLFYGLHELFAQYRNLFSLSGQACVTIFQL